MSLQDDFNDAVRKFVKDYIAGLDDQVDADFDKAAKEIGLDDATKRAFKQSFDAVRDKQRQGGQ